MKVLLDTNIVIALLQQPQGPLRSRLECFAPNDVGISAVVSHELFFGAYRSARTADHLARVEAMQFEVVPLDADDAREAGEIRAFLAQQGTPIGPYDVLIAGQARCRGCLLVTNNMREFQRVPHLNVECWT